MECKNWTNIASTMGCPNSNNRPTKGLCLLWAKQTLFEELVLSSFKRLISEGKVNFDHSYKGL
jgi:hypothetical protein